MAVDERGRVDSAKFNSSATENERKFMQVVWAKEIDASPSDSVGKFPSFVLVGSAKHVGDLYVFSIYSRALYAKCEPPPNGRSATQMYSVCPLRINRIDDAGKSVSQEFPGFCKLNLDFPDTPRVKNHTEYAVDSRTQIAYFRVIQYGKLVPQCNRSVLLSRR